jgi:hypothetical protein
VTTGKNAEEASKPSPYQYPDPNRNQAGEPCMEKDDSVNHLGGEPGVNTSQNGTSNKRRNGILTGQSIKNSLFYVNRHPRAPYESVAEAFLSMLFLLQDTGTCHFGEKSVKDLRMSAFGPIGLFSAAI